MANIVENTTKKNMQTHIEKAYKFLDEHLPFSYSGPAQELLQHAGVDASLSVIKNVRAKMSIRIDVLNALLDVARQERSRKEELIKKIS